MVSERFGAWLTFAAIILGLSFALSTSSLSFTDAAIIGTAGIVISHFFLHRDWYWPLHRKDQRVVLYFAGIVTLGALFLPANNAEFAGITLYLLGFFFVVRYLKHLEYDKVILRAYAIAGFISALYGATWWLYWSTDGERFGFIFDDPNVYGAFLVPASLFFLWRALAKNPRTGYRMANVFAISVVYSAILLTLSRGVWIQLIVASSALVALLFFARQLDKTSYKLMGAGILTVIVGGLFIGTSIQQLVINKLAEADEVRLENFSYAIEAISDFSTHQFLVGYGNGSYEQFSPHQFEAHNTYLRLLFENGIFGFILFLFLIAGVFYKNREQFLRPDTAILLCSLLGILTHSLVIDTLHWRHLWLIVGLL